MCCGILFSSGRNEGKKGRLSYSSLTRSKGSKESYCTNSKLTFIRLYRDEIIMRRRKKRWKEELRDATTKTIIPVFFGVSLFEFNFLKR